MQIETKEIIKKEYVNSYVAIDGSRFNSEVECKKYEESALFAVSKKLKKLSGSWINTENHIFFV